MAARILILEDDRDLQSMLVTVLETAGYEVTAASSGDEAIGYASACAFDLVVTDIRMEGMDGLEALEHVRDQRPDVKSLVITGYSSEQDSVRAIRMGVGGFLKKPFSLDEFLGSVRELLAKRREENSRLTAESNLTLSLHWVLRALAGSFEQSPGAPRLSHLAEVASRVCRALGLSREASMTVELASMYKGISLVAGSALPGDAPPWPVEVERVLRSTEEWFDGTGGPDQLRGEAIPLESRVASVVVASFLEGVTADDEPLNDQFPGRFDPTVLAALEQLEQANETYPSAAEHRTLLSLARALEEAGNAASARQAFAKLAESSPSRFSVEALSGLARISMAEGAADEACDYAVEAARRAQQVGPTQTANTALEVALMLVRCNRPDQSLPWLDTADRAYASLGIEAGRAAVKIARLGQGERIDQDLTRALEILLLPENAERMVNWSYWIVPRVLETTFEAPFVASMTRLVREYPRAVLRSVAQGRGTSQSRFVVAQSLKNQALSGRESILRTLASDSDAKVRQEALAALAENQPGQAAPILRIYSLGPLEVYRGEERIQEAEWKSQKGKYLLALLAAHRGRAVSDDVVQEVLWGSEPDPEKRKLYWATSMLRRCLKFEESSIEAVLRTPFGLQLNPELNRWHDLEEFEDLAEAVKQRGSKDYNLERFLRVLELYRGPYLEGCYLDWAVNERNRLEQLAAGLLGRFVDWALSTNRFHEALDYSRRLIEIDPYRQEAHLAPGPKRTCSIGQSSDGPPPTFLKGAAAAGAIAQYRSSASPTARRRARSA